MTEAVRAGQGDAAQPAMLHDRLLVNEGRPQIYGTQIAGLDPFAVHVAEHAPA